MEDENPTLGLAIDEVESVELSGVIGLHDRLMAMKSVNRGLIVTVVVGAILIVTSLWLVLQGPAFDREKWIASDGGFGSPRAGMIYGALAQLKPGMTEAQVVHLLGKPAYREQKLPDIGTYLSKEEVQRVSVVYVYPAGNPWFDPALIYVAFDRTGRLLKAWDVVT